MMSKRLVRLGILEDLGHIFRWNQCRGMFGFHGGLLELLDKQRVGLA